MLNGSSNHVFADREASPCAFPFPFSLPGCEVTATQNIDDTLVIDARTTAATASCPACGTSTTRIHSRYLRIPRDLPVSTKRVQVRLHVRRFFCDQFACSRRTFAERLPDVLPPKAQRTTRLTSTLYDLGTALGGSAGAYLASRLRICTSPDTIVRVLRCHLKIIGRLNVHAMASVTSVRMSRLPLHANGTIIKTTTLSADEIATLTTLVNSTNFTAVKAVPFTGTCPTAYDGGEAPS